MFPVRSGKLIDNLQLFPLTQIDHQEVVVLFETRLVDNLEMHTSGPSSLSWISAPVTGGSIGEFLLASSHSRGLHAIMRGVDGEPHHSLIWH